MRCFFYLRLIIVLGVLSLPGCAIEAEAGWADDLERSITDRSSVFRSHPTQIDHTFAPTSADIRAGDELLYGLCLDLGETRKVWYLQMRVLEVQARHFDNWRQQSDFEARVHPSAAKRAEMHKASLAAREEREELGSNWSSFSSEEPVARILVEAFDADGTSLGSARSETTVRLLREGLIQACKAGYAQRELMRGRVALGRAAEMLELNSQQYDDVEIAGEGVAACRRIFEILQSNPVTKDILFEVIALPTVWSMITRLGVDIGFEVDFFAARPLARSRLPASNRDLWSAPLNLQLNGQPALLTRIVTGPSSSPDATAAGVFAIVGRHPSDPGRRVHVQLLGSRRKTVEPAP
ncbi:MAG: hypothetical protein ACI89X_001358 [Planctomycetota bacterium]